MTDPAMSTSFLDVLIQLGGSATVLAFVACGLILLGASGLKRMRRRAVPPQAAQAIGSGVTLEALERTGFAARPLMGKEEMRLYRCLDVWERRQKKGFLVLAGVPLSAAISPTGSDADLANMSGLGELDQVRLDFLVIDASGAPVLGIDLPGRAAGPEAEARAAALRQIVFDKARLRLLAPEAGTSPSDVIAKVDHMLDTGLMNHGTAAAASNASPSPVPSTVAQVA